MKQDHLFLGLSLAMLMGFSGAATAAGDTIRGQELYQTMCMSCPRLTTTALGRHTRGCLAGRLAVTLITYIHQL